jgi:hypothetical protein
MYRAILSLRMYRNIGTCESIIKDPSLLTGSRTLTESFVGLNSAVRFVACLVGTMPEPIQVWPRMETREESPFSPAGHLINPFQNIISSAL